MEDLLDDIDELVTPGLSTDAPNWCASCQSLRQELKQLKDDHCQNFSKLKQKIINTDLLIKKFKAKCDDYDLQCKRTEEANKRADKFQRQCEILESQLKAALLDTEPLRKTKVTLEEELYAKKTECQSLSDRLIATEIAQKQYEQLSKTNSATLIQLEEEKRELLKKIKLFETGKLKRETVKEFKNEIQLLKKENSSLQKENESLKKTEERLEKRVLSANKNIDELNKTIKELGTRRKASPVKSPFRSPRFGRYKSPTKSPVCKKLHPPASTSQVAPCEQKLEFITESSLDDTDDEDDDSVCSVAWTFSPITQCISPLPPSPAGFVNQNDIDGNVSDIADELEQFLDEDDENNPADDGELETTLTDSTAVKTEKLVQQDLETTNCSSTHLDTAEIEPTCDNNVKENCIVNDSEGSNNDQQNDNNYEINMQKSNNEIKNKGWQETVNVSLESDTSDSRTKSDSTVKVKNSVENDETVKCGEPHLEMSNNIIVSIDKVKTTPDKSDALREQESHQTEKSESVLRTTENSRQSLKERIAGSIEIMSPTALKKSSSPLKVKEGNIPFKLGKGNNNSVDSVKSGTRTPFIRRSARIQSKRDSETSEAESDSNTDKTSHSMKTVSTANSKSEISHKRNTNAAGIVQSAASVENSSEIVIKAENSDKEEKGSDDIEKRSRVVKKALNIKSENFDEIKKSLDVSNECVQDTSKDLNTSIDTQNKVSNKIIADNSDSSISSLHSTKTTDVIANNDTDKCENSGRNFCNTEGERNELNDKIDSSNDIKEQGVELSEGIEIDVWKEMQTETVIPKPLPKQSCLIRQAAVSNTSHLFNDLQAIRSKQTGNKNNKTHSSKSKSKFSVNDFIPFQRSSAGTLSNEIDNLHTEHDYDLVSREEVQKQPVELPEQVSKYVKGLQKKMKRTCKYVDFDSEDYKPHNKSKVTNHSRSRNNLDNSVLGSNLSGKINSAADSHTHLQPTYSVKATDSAPSVKIDSKQSIRSPEDKVIINTPDNLGIQCDENSANVKNEKINKIECMDHVASNKDKETSDEPHDPDNDGIDRTDKIVPSRQLSTGFSITSASFERTSSTESGVSLRCSPAKLFSLESGSCDTILEDVDENVIDEIKDEPDCNNDGDKNDNVIFGVEDIMNNEHETTYDTTDNKPPQSLVKCAKDRTMDITLNTESEFVKTINESSVNTDIMDVKPGCSGYNTERKYKSEEHLFTQFKEEKFNPSKFATDEFTCSSNESSRSSFGLLGRDSPMSDMFLSNFEFLNPVSPLPPSPVRELEDNTAAEDLYEDFDEGENQPVDSENKYTGKNENVKRLLSKKNTVKDNKCKAKTKGKALLKKSKDSSNKNQLPFSSLDTLNDKVKIESENMLKDTPGISEASHIKVENLKMSPLPGMISPVKSPSVKQCQHTLGKKIIKLERRVKSEHNIMDEDGRIEESDVKSEVDEVGAGDSLVNMRSKTSVEKTVISDTSAKPGDSVTKKRKISFSKKQKSSESSADKNTAPVRRKSALVDQILRKRTEANKQNEIEKTQKYIDTSAGTIINPMTKRSKTCIKSDSNVNVPTDQLQPAEVNTAKENEVVQEVQGTLDAAETSVDEKGDQNVLEELPTGHDNLAFKKKTRVAHKPNMQPLKPQKVQVIEAPHLPPVVRGRKRKSNDGMNKDGQDKKPKSSFRKQKNETCVKKEDTRRMQAFLKSTDLADKLVTMVTGIHGTEHVGNILLLSCLECIGRVMTDPLDIVYENCITDTYSSINTDFPFLSDVEKRAVYLIRHLLENQLIDKDQLMRSAWNTVLCRNLTVNVIGKMAQCRLFIALCAVQGDLELARVMLYQLVTCTYLNFILFIVPVVSIWPEVLRKSPEDQPDVVVNHGLTLVLEELITERLLSTNDELSKKILLILQKLCLWSGVCGTAESVLHMLFTKLKACTSEESDSDCVVFELTKALNLLCSSKPWSWVKLNFIEKHGLQSAAYKYTAKLITVPIPAKYMCAVLRTTSYILSVHASTIRERDYQQIIRNWILPVLKKKQCDPEVLMCCIETLIELTPLYLPCLEMIQRWFQETKHTVSDELVVRLEDLRMQYKQQFGLQCKPFIKS